MLLTTSQAAAKLGCSTAKVKRLIKDGTLADHGQNTRHDRQTRHNFLIDPRDLATYKRLQRLQAETRSNGNGHGPEPVATPALSPEVKVLVDLLTAIDHRMSLIEETTLELLRVWTT